MPSDKIPKALVRGLPKIPLLCFREEGDGFSLLELVSVVVVLGILASITTPWVSSFIKTTKIDSVKAKLNSAAASCLQDIRSGQDPSQAIGDDILSNELLVSDGYKISSDMRSCSSLMIVGDDEDDPYFFPMGFTIADGSLTKFAFPLSQDSEAACKSWAGTNCKAGEELLDLIAHNKAVEEAKTKCNEAFYTWLNGNPPAVPAGDGKRNRWDPTADSACKRVPPANKSSTCTPSGCSLETWAFEGTIVAGEDGYKEALERKYGKICSEKLELKLQEKYTGGPVSILECGATKKLWFFEGVDQGSEAEMNKLICEKKQGQYEDERTTGTITIPECTISTCTSEVDPATGIISTSECGDKKFFYCLGDDKGTEELMKDCISKNKEASCQNAINEALTDNHDGEFIAEEGGPGVCSSVIWMCEGKQFSTESSYKESGCGKSVCSQDTIPHPICTNSAFHGTQLCSEWATCMYGN